jgi:phage terminase large subunit-like protein
MARAMIELGMTDEPTPEVETICHEATGRLRLADLRVWKPKTGHRVSLEAVRTSILMAHRQFKLAAVAFDPYQGEHLAELLERAGVPVIRTPQTSVSLQEQATALVEAIQQRSIDIFPNDDVLADLKRLQIRDTGLKIRLVSPEATGDGAGTGHGDVASALSFAVALAKNRFSLPMTSIRGKMLAY